MVAADLLIPSCRFATSGQTVRLLLVQLVDNSGLEQHSAVCYKTLMKPLRLSIIACLAFVALKTHAACEMPTSGIVSWWPADGSAAALVGTASTPNGVAFEPGMVGQAFGFDGTTQYVATDLDAQPSALPETTWEAWVYPTRLNHGARQQVLSLDSGGYGRSVLIEGGSTEFAVFTGMGAWRAAQATADEWQHIAVVYAATNIYFYRNGVQSSFGQAAVARTSSHKLAIGRNPGYGEYFEGLIDEVTIYNRALGAEEIQAIFMAGTDGKCKEVGTADLALTLHTAPSISQVNEYITNTITVANEGPDPVSGVSVVADVPPGASFSDGQVSQGTLNAVGTQVNCAIGNLGVGETAWVRLAFKMTAIGPQTYSATITSLYTDPDPSNNQAMDMVDVLYHYTPEDGDWAAKTVVLRDTPEAALMVRTGDIDNLGFGWPSGFDPFSGNSTPGHGFPWAVPTNEPAGTDRIMVVTSYSGTPPYGGDGYTAGTSRPDNEVQAVELNYNLEGMPVNSAALQLFVDDFQAPNWHALYTVKLNGIQAPFIETIINGLSQTGPIGKLISVSFPAEFLPLLQANRLSILIDDLTTGAGDGFAIDFAKLLININAFGQVGTIKGVVVDSLNQQPIPGVRIWVAGYSTYTDATGSYLLRNIPAGLSIVEATHPDYVRQTVATDLVTGQTNTVSFNLVVQPHLQIQLIGGEAVISWPASLGGYSLQVSPSLAASELWVPEGSVPAVVNGRNWVTNSIALPARFYRLAKP